MRVCFHGHPDCDGAYPPLCANCQTDLENRRDAFAQFEAEMENQAAITAMLRAEHGCQLCLGGREP